MKFFVHVSRLSAPSSHCAWTVEVRDRSQVLVGGGPRSLRCVDEAGEGPVWRFPQVQPNDTLPGPEHRLIGSATASDIGRIYGSVVVAGGQKDVARVFGRYLFHTLIGPATWAAIETAAGAQPVELALSWADDEWVFTRLPWELMHDGQQFLTAHPSRLITLERVITPAEPPAGPVPLSPRVLFVIGSHLDDPEIRAGAEYIGLTRRLYELCLRLDCRVLVGASPNRLRDAVQSFRPSIVHFIAHGDVGPSGGTLHLQSDDPAFRTHGCAADTLLRLLAIPELTAKKGRLPAIVVLNACFTATPRVPDTDGASPSDAVVVGGERGSLPTQPSALPLAAALVRGEPGLGGVPLVVGMGGKVSDLACRLFTRRFYEALLTGAPAAAAAEGRRKAYEHQSYDREQIDWAVPTIFVAKGSELAVVKAEWDLTARRERVARSFQLVNDPPAFCGRLPFFHHHARLLAPAAATPAPPRVMAIYERREPGSGKYGRKRLLQELAVHTVRTGHIPVLVPASDNPPTTARDVVKTLALSTEQTCDHFGIKRLPRTALNVIALLDALHGERATLDAGVASDLQHLSEIAALRTALRLDLEAVRLHVAKVLYSKSAARNATQVVVLVADVHRFGSAAEVFVRRLVDGSGLGNVASPIPVVFTFRKERAEACLDEVFAKLHQFVSERPNYLVDQELLPLDTPERDRSIYLHFLLNRQKTEKPLVPQPSLSAAGIEKVFRALHRDIGAIPSNLASTNGNLTAAIAALVTTEQLAEASDEEIVAQIEGQ